ncbi:chitosanase, partial [Elaphomyces granulatus]
LPAIANARKIPVNLQSFYNDVKNVGCSKKLRGGFKDGDGNPGFSYCSHQCTDQTTTLLYLAGPKSMPLGGMNVDCDGAKNTGGKCSNDPSGQSQSAFQDTVKSYGIPDLNANIHGYVVFGNEGAIPAFSPETAGMKPLSVMAVVCGENLFYGVWGDTNGADNTGEVSISLATACFPNAGITGNNGHDAHDILYIGFTGQTAVPGKNGAKWDATSFEEFEASLTLIGDSLVAKVP